MSDLDVEQCLEGLQLAGLGNLQSAQKHFQIVIAANKFDRSLSSECGVPGKNQDRTRRVETQQEAHNSIILNSRMIGGSGQKRLRFPGQRMHVVNSEIP